MSGLFWRDVVDKRSYYNEKMAHPYKFRPWKTKDQRGPARPKVKGVWRKAA